MGPEQVTITDYAACEGLVAFAEQRFGGVDALVQVAAFDAVFGTLATITRGAKPQRGSAYSMTAAW